MLKIHTDQDILWILLQEPMNKKKVTFSLFYGRMEAMTEDKPDRIILHQLNMNTDERRNGGHEHKHQRC